MIMTGFDSFVQLCKTIADDLQTIVEVKEYREYGWAGIAFMTDHFGGIYINFHYDLKTDKVVNWYGHKDAEEITDYKLLPNFVKEKMNKELKSRDFEALYEMINAEY